jgi:hypothetical protein
VRAAPRLLTTSAALSRIPSTTASDLRLADRWIAGATRPRCGCASSRTLDLRGHRARSTARRAPRDSASRPRSRTHRAQGSA